MSSRRGLTRNQDSKIGSLLAGMVTQLGLRAFPRLRGHFSAFPWSECWPPTRLPWGSHTQDVLLHGYGQLHAPRLWRNKELRTLGSCRGQPPPSHAPLVPPGAWHPPGHGAWHGRVGAGPGGSVGRREEGEEGGSGSGRGLRREMSSRRPGLDWLGARLGEFSEPGAPSPHSGGPLG